MKMVQMLLINLASTFAMLSCRSSCPHMCVGKWLQSMDKEFFKRFPTKCTENISQAKAEDIS